MLCSQRGSGVLSESLCARVCIQMLRVLSDLLYHSLHVLLKQGLSLNPSLEFSWLDWKAATTAILLSLPSSELRLYMCTECFSYCVVAGIQNLEQALLPARLSFQFPVVLGLQHLVNPPSNSNPGCEMQLFNSMLSSSGSFTVL